MKNDFQEELVFPNLPSSSNDDSLGKEWAYSMRRDMQEIIPNIYLGPYSAASRTKLGYLQEHGVTHIVCIRHPMESKLIKPNFPETFIYLVLEIIDHPDEQIMNHFPVVRDFINDCLCRGGKVLIQGNAGISRSASFMIAYLMETYGMKYKQATLHVLDKRFCIFPNAGFVRQLNEYEPIYLARYQQRLLPQREATSKRSLDEDEPESHNKRCLR